MALGSLSKRCRPSTNGRIPDQFGAPILTFSDSLEEFKAATVLGSVGMPAIRRRLVEQWPGQNYLTFVLSSRLGSNRQQHWIGLSRCTHGGGEPLLHARRPCAGECRSDHQPRRHHRGYLPPVSPGCSVGGLVSIGKGSFLGIGCTVRDRVSVGDGVLVAAGAVVVDDVQDGQVVMGVPATPRQGRNAPW